MNQILTKYFVNNIFTDHDYEILFRSTQVLNIFKTQLFWYGVVFFKWDDIAFNIQFNVYFCMKWSFLQFKISTHIHPIYMYCKPIGHEVEVH